MSRQRLRFGAHHHRPDVRCDLDDPVDAPCEVRRIRLRLPAGLGQMLIPDPVVRQQLPQHTTIKLRPPRPRHTPHIAQKLDLVLPKQSKKIVESMPAMANTKYLPHGLHGNA